MCYAIYVCSKTAEGGGGKLYSSHYYLVCDAILYVVKGSKVDAPEGEEDDRLDGQKLAQRLEGRQLLQIQAVQDYVRWTLEEVVSAEQVNQASRLTSPQHHVREWLVEIELARLTSYRSW